MKYSLLSAPVLALLLACACDLSAPQAQGAVHISVGGGYTSFQYDSAGFPIWGFTASGRPIYGYTPAGVPILFPSGIYAGCYVPSWGPADFYTGSYWWPAGVCRVSRFTPPPPPVYHPAPRPVTPPAPSFGPGGPSRPGAPFPGGTQPGGGHGGPGGPGGPRR
jgi:hypothetical protein